MRVSTRLKPTTAMIKQRMMGRTGLKLSELCLGTLNFGWKTDEKTSFAILDAYRASGGNFIQSTSHAPEVVLPSASASVSEEIVGRWWKERGLRREELFLATRIHVRPRGDARSFAQTVEQACQDSLRRLQTDYLDLVVFEWNDGLVPIRYSLEAFDRAVRNWLARFVGVANFPVWRVVDALGRAYLRNYCRLEAIQSDYSLLTRARFEPEAMALCQEQRVAFFARSPLAGGFLARRNGMGDLLNASRRDWLMKRFGNPYGDAALAAAGDVAARHEASSAQVALAWVLHNPAVTSAILGVRSVAQLHELVQASRLALTRADLDQLHESTALEEVRVSSEILRRRSETQEELVLA
jgi:aryl-alcohol dehydrogenase-like predicted oxidoreductase